MTLKPVKDLTIGSASGNLSDRNDEPLTDLHIIHWDKTRTLCGRTLTFRQIDLESSNICSACRAIYSEYLLAEQIRSLTPEPISATQTHFKLLSDFVDKLGYIPRAISWTGKSIVIVNEKHEHILVTNDQNIQDKIDLLVDHLIDDNVAPFGYNHPVR